MSTVQQVGFPDEQLTASRGRVRAALTDADAPGAAAALRALVEIDAEIGEEAQARRSSDVEALASVHEAMRALRACATPKALIESAPRELLRVSGFTRVMISRVRGSVWDPVVLETVPDVDPEADRFRDFIQEVKVPLEHLLLETDLVRRRTAALVKDAGHDTRTFRPLVEVARSTSYVAAPIQPTRRVIGFFHADRFGQAQPCTEQDRDMLWTFAEHFGLLFERAVLLERLEEQRAKLQLAFAEAAAGIAELNESELALVRRGPLAEPASLARRRKTGESRIEALLTKREREIVDLLVGGATNAGIARELVVSEGTVKSHLKRILRKLHVTNRAEAVAKYLHILRLDEDGADR